MIKKKNIENALYKKIDSVGVGKYIRLYMTRNNIV